MATESLPLSPTMLPSGPQNGELLFSGDPKFARHGVILMLVFVLLFSVFLLVLAMIIYMKRVRSDLKQNEGSKLEA
ncbi:hypothetical protein VNO77_07434 [Canavalia gladiata]|uniref:Uncharacterized protein n=1 Tax=Canavalia gladiata TaxID=3824 RepID=A0AAN9QWM3_CANGL